MAIGDIGSVIDSLEFDTSRCIEPKIIHISGSIYAIVYSGVDDGGWLVTVSIDSSGNIGPTIIDSLEFDIYCETPVIIHVSGNVYAIAYQGTEYDYVYPPTYPVEYGEGWLVTVTIDSNGEIGDAVVDSFQFALIGWEPSIVHVSGDVYAIAYYYWAGDPPEEGWQGRLITVTVDSSGNIGDAVIDTYALPYVIEDSDLIHVSGDVYAIVYQYFHGVFTITINPDGTIVKAIIDELALGYLKVPKIIHISGDVYAVVCQKVVGGYWNIILDTVSINSAGEVGDTVIDTSNLTPGNIHYTSPDILRANGNVFAIAYQEGLVANDGFLKTITIEDNGSIGSVIDTLEFDTEAGLNPSIIQVMVQAVGGIYAIAYRGADADGWLKTVPIGTIVPTVTTNPATALSAISATPNGILDADGGEACDCGFEWGLTVAYDNTTPTQSRTTGQTFAQIITGLDPNKTYHFRAFATNSAGTSYGADRSFATPLGIPTVTTDPATGLGAVLATLNGTLDDDGGEASECGFEWGLDTGYGVTTPTVSKITGQSFSQVIHGLFPGITYHFRAFATNSVGTAYGSDETFTTALVVSRAYALAREEL